MVGPRGPLHGGGVLTEWPSAGRSNDAGKVAKRAATTSSCGCGEPQCLEEDVITSGSRPQPAACSSRLRSGSMLMETPCRLTQ